MGKFSRTYFRSGTIARDLLPLVRDALEGKYAVDREIAFAAHPEIVGSIKALLSKGVKVIFLEGNHDMYLSQKDLGRVP